MTSIQLATEPCVVALCAHTESLFIENNLSLRNNYILLLTVLAAGPCATFIRVKRVPISGGKEGTNIRGYEVIEIRGYEVTKFVVTRVSISGVTNV